jgi:hypothetical protein
VTGGLSLLSPNTTYHYRVAASIAGSTVYGGDMTFTTAALPSLPAATTAAATVIGSGSATLNGAVNANDNDTTVTFEYGETTAYGETVAADPSPVTGSSDSAVSFEVASLDANTVYHYRVVATSAAGTTNGADMTFTTNPAGTPVVATVGVSNVVDVSAVCEGNVSDDGGSSVTARGICWRTSPHPTISDAVTSEGDGTGAYSGSLTGLAPSTTYYVRAWATNENGTAYGNQLAFSTGVSPDAVTGSPTAIGADSAVLNGTVNANGVEASVTFEYGETTAYGSTVTADRSLVTGSEDTAVSAGIGPLSEGALYHYRTVARNGWMAAYGEDRIFMTAGGGDHDGDGLSDFDEVNTYGTDHLDADTDNDGLPDGTEVGAGLDPLAAQGPGIPVLVSPEGDETQVDLSPLLEVAYAEDATVDGHNSTRWQIGPDGDFSTVAADITSETHLLTLPVPELVLDGDTTYYWRVRFSESDGLEKLWSDTGAFTTASGARGDGNGNGLPDDQELSGDETGDFDPETETGWQDTLTYLVFEAGDGTAAQAALRLSDDGSSLSFFKHATKIPDEGPAALDMGLFSIRLHVPAAGDATFIRLYFSPSPLDEDSRVYKYDTASGWFEYTGYAEPSEDLSFLTIELVDGGYGDADGAANGVIVDPLGTSTAGSDDTDGETPAPPSGSGGGGCFIDGLEKERGTFWEYALLLTLLVIVVPGRILFRKSR